MARPLRIQYPGAYYHVTARGVGRGPIFFGDDDREDFLQRLAETHDRWGLEFHAYVLMENHYHAEIQTPEANLSRAMQWLNHVYAAGVNRRHGRVGHLFQGRFKSVLVEAETQLHVLTRYIHLNPVRAHMLGRPAEYRWSSYRDYVGMRKPPGWLNVASTLRMFGRTQEEQRRRYRRFVEQELDVEEPLKEMAFGAMLGSPQFVEWARGKLEEQEEDAEIAGLGRALPRPTPGAISEAVAGEYGVDVSQVLVKGRKRNEARDVAIYLSRECSGCKHTDIGQHFGGLRPSAVSLACGRVAERMRASRRRARQVLELARKVRGMV